MAPGRSPAIGAVSTVGDRMAAILRVDDVAETLIATDPSSETGHFTLDDGQEGATDR